jgi:hypothetical protein
MIGTKAFEDIASHALRLGRERLGESGTLVVVDD